jgi:hypothetical protein
MTNSRAWRVRPVDCRVGSSSGAEVSCIFDHQSALFKSERRSSTSELLKVAPDGLIDKASLGLVRYGTGHLENIFSTVQFITTKQASYESECEARAWLTVYDPLASGNRHIDLNNFPPSPAARNQSPPFMGAGL